MAEEKEVYKAVYQGSGTFTITKPKRKKIAWSANGPTQMVVKRSVSPDGRIDSLSVEFTAPVEPIVTLPFTVVGRLVASWYVPPFCTVSESNVAQARGRFRPPGAAVRPW